MTAPDALPDDWYDDQDDTDRPGDAVLPPLPSARDQSFEDLDDIAFPE